MKTAAKKAKPKREWWGRWANKSHLLRYHPSHRNGATVFVAAYANEVLSVQVSNHDTAWGAVTHLWVHRHDDGPLTWREMQRVKNELVGPERVAVEVYPPVSELVDGANMFHLWVLPEGFALPFSLKKSEHLEPTP